MIRVEIELSTSTGTVMDVAAAVTTALRTTDQGTVVHRITVEEMDA